MLSQAGFYLATNVYRFSQLLPIFALVKTSVLNACDDKTLISRRRFKNQFLSINSFKNTEVRSVIECVALCSDTLECESVNYCVQDELDVRGNCSLNKEHLCHRGVNSLVPVSGCEYLDSLPHISKQDTDLACFLLKCQNGGRCSAFCGSDIVTCECTPSSFGNRCQHVNGGWGAWGNWHCYDDVYSRYRRCDNPSRVGEGRTCRGSRTEWKDKD